MNQISMISLTIIAAVVALFLILLTIFFFVSKYLRIIWLRYKIHQIEKAQKEIKKNDT